MRMAARLDAMGSEKYKGLTRKSGGRYVWTGKISVDRGALEIPTRWKKPRMIFVNSMSDLFQDRVPASFIKEVWDVMFATPQHTYQILTKRPDRMAELTAQLPILKNVWLGTSVENAAQLLRIDELRKVRAVVRFVSFEPLIGSVKNADLSEIHWAIVGGESGPRAREMLPVWVREIKSQCRNFGTAFFFKQWGGKNKAATGRKLYGRTWDEFPTVATAY
jgi:protein gp37